MRAAGVAGDVAADLRLLGRAGIGREAKAVLAREPVDLAGRHSGLDVDPPKQRVELADATQTIQAEDDAAVERNRTAGEPGAAASRRDRHIVLVAPGHDARDFFGRGRVHDRIRAAERGAPGQVGQVVSFGLRDRVCGQDRGERVRGGGHRSLVLAASSRSRSVTPPAVCVHQRSVTLFQWIAMSG